MIATTSCRTPVYLDSLMRSALVHSFAVIGLLGWGWIRIDRSAGHRPWAQTRAQTPGHRPPGTDPPGTHRPMSGGGWGKKTRKEQLEGHNKATSAARAQRLQLAFEAARITHMCVERASSTSAACKTQRPGASNPGPSIPGMQVCLQHGIHKKGSSTSRSQLHP